MKDINEFSETAQALSQRSVDLYSLEELERKLKKGNPLRIKYGADPSAPDIHLGHVVGLNKLREFQEQGHKIVFIIGDFTAMIGDPSGRSKTRPQLSREAVRENAATYQDQLFKILDSDNVEVHFNSEWFTDMPLDIFSRIASHVTVAQILQREDFGKRYSENTPISLAEFLYPLIQAYDSVMVQADVELGGTDQLFNFLLGREMQKAFDQEPQVVMTLPLIEGLDGTRKMSKSLNNYVGITETPSEMFGKLMSVNDQLMWRYFSLVLCTPPDEIETMKSSGENPRDTKEKMACEIISRFHGPAAALQASEEFHRIFTQKKQPLDIPEVVLPAEQANDTGLLTLLVQTGLASSNSEARRLIEQGGVTVGQEKITDFRSTVPLKEGMIVKVGKRRFVKILLK